MIHGLTTDTFICNYNIYSSQAFCMIYHPYNTNLTSKKILTLLRVQLNYFPKIYMTLFEIILL